MIYTAEVGRVSNREDLVYNLIVFKNIKKNGEVFRDHVWVKKEKRMDKIKLGDNIEFTATEYTYGKDKIGLKKIRNIKRIWIEKTNTKR
ncbi:MAG: hypothetical protein LGB58_07075 [Sulfurovum sp.]|nr:hypothetical protein [Sulfurovum sp.]